MASADAQPDRESRLRAMGRAAPEIFGSPDDPKLRSCAALFVRVTPGLRILPPARQALWGRT
jgi:uncharacterized protein (DUF1810 family)